MHEFLERWHLDSRQLRAQVDRAPTPPQRERWHAPWRLARGGSAAQVAAALERDPHTIGDWLAAFGRGGPATGTFMQTGGSPPPSARTPQPT